MDIIGTIDDKVRRNTVRRCRERSIRIPTLSEMRDPSLVPAAIRERLPKVGLDDIDPANLFRITWKNDPNSGLFHDGNRIEFPASLTGVEARIVGLVGRWFPTGSHKVGAGFGCLVPRLVNGSFDPTAHKAVWPSTGNYCRGGAFDCALLACHAIAILPEGMSRERFEWLRAIGAEVIATPGSESNVKEIFDKCAEIRRTRPDCVIFNQFDEFGNAVWHYHVTGPFAEETWRSLAADRSRAAAYVSATGSAGTIAAGDYLRSRFPEIRIVAAEALQCPTLLLNGFGEHGIEGIGDKHVPWIHNVRNTDLVCAVDDAQCLSLLRLFNEEEGARFLASEGVPDEIVGALPLLGISSICNLIAAIKTARFYEMDSRDILLLPLTDSAALYRSRVEEMRRAAGPLDRTGAARIFERRLRAATIDYVEELGHRGKKRLHNLKYFTWVEQQGKSADDLRLLWEPDTWAGIYASAGAWDRAIEEFNRETGLG
ncbi:MAG: pyridoxal-phosphate dependent enzyme [Candidatus Latescibacterota bacterium]|nr:MAG: pyridoxal-phosphate dependent enzyme [Candidatus Latescibacterota bacterium]